MRQWQALCISALLISINLINIKADESLKSAVKALHRKQRDISLYQNPYLIGNGQPEDIGYGFQKSLVPNSLGVFDSGPLPQSELGAYGEGVDNDALQKLILDYLQEEEEAERYSRYPSVKRSVFRENAANPVDAFQTLRNEQERDDSGSAFRERNVPKWRLRKAHALVRNFGGLNEQQVAQEDALNVLNSIWEKYRNEEAEGDDEDTKSLFEYAYPGGEDEKQKRQYGGSYSGGYDFFNSPFQWTKRNPNDYTRDEDVGRLLLAPRYPANNRYDEAAFDDRYRTFDKRYPIAKRSTNHQHKRNSGQQTDPKIQQEISDIFSPHKNNSKEKTAQKAQQTSTTPPVKNETKDTKKDMHKDKGQKELSTGNALDKPVDIKKKSIRWADYFGIDKRKKKSAGGYPAVSGYPAASDGWLIDQYMKAYGNRYPQLYDKPKRYRGEDMDSKLKSMEDLIVDQAIKYTGSHEGLQDPSEMEQVKDQVMSQLAAAYSLEKMRRALGEFRNSIQQQTLSAKPHSHHAQEHVQQTIPSVAASEASKTEVKAKTVPTVQAKLEKKNNDIRENSINISPYDDFERDEDCPVLDAMVERCSIASAAALDKEAAFLPLCVLHQICDQCDEGENCDVTFIRETGRSCGGDGLCRLTARRVLDAVRSLRPQPLACHQPCLVSFLAKRR